MIRILFPAHFNQAAFRLSSFPNNVGRRPQEEEER